MDIYKPTVKNKHAVELDWKARKTDLASSNTGCSAGLHELRVGSLPSLDAPPGPASREVLHGWFSFSLVDWSLMKFGLVWSCSLFSAVLALLEGRG